MAIHVGMNRSMTQYRIPLWRSSASAVALAFLLLGAAAPGCGDDGHEHGSDGGSSDFDATTATTQSVSIDVAARVGLAAAACGATYDGVGLDGDTIEFKDLRFYVSNVRLVDGTNEVEVELDQDSPFQTENVALLDFEDQTGKCANGTTELNTAITGSVPVGHYDGLLFDLAVPFDLNHKDPTTQASPLNVSAMFWTWAVGHKFLRIDLEVNSAGTPVPWNIHLGSIACGAMGTSEPTMECAKPNRPTIKLATFDSETDQVVFDIAALLADSQVAVDSGGTPGCQSFPDDVAECTPLFPNLGLDYATGACTNDCADQSVFSVEAK
jgi:uncharacterized repeat protein (TIGR04052 family)